MNNYINKNNILYSSDNKYIDIMLSSILSLIKNSNLSDIKLHIITENFSSKDYKKVESFISNFSNIELNFYPIEEINIDKYKIPDWRGCQIANSRLFFQEIIDDKLTSMKNLLYLDSDTIIVSDLNDIYDYQDKTICACKDRVRKNYSKKLNLDEYYNSGVLFLNTEKWIKDDCQDRIIKQLSSEERKLTFPDQDILNITFKDQISTLPLKYNVNPDTFIYKNIIGKLYFNQKERNISYEEALAARRDPKILHSYGLSEIKPWSKNKVNPYNEIYMEYISKINPDFNQEELTDLKRIMNINTNLFYSYYFLKPYISLEIKDEAAKMILKIKNKNKK